MSAFIVSNRHIDFLLTYAEKKRVPALAAFMLPNDNDNDHLNRAGRCLLDENHRSVAYRYSVKQDKSEYVFKKYIAMEGDTKMLIAEEVRVIKALHCLDYQCCEVGNHPEKFIDLYDGIMDCAIRNLPGYSQATWGIE